MRKYFTIALCLLGAGVMSADRLQEFSCGVGTPGLQEPMLIGIGISPNGKYICGPIENALGFFVASVETGEVRWTFPEEAEDGELRHVDNNGLAIGFDDSGLTYDFTTGEITYLFYPDNVKYILAEDLSADGSTKVGSYVAGGFITEAVVATDGTDDWKPLPLPAEEEYLGDLKGKLGSAAKYVSADGKVILGCLGSFTVPIIWTMNDEGEYEIDMFINRYVKFLDEDADDDSKPLWSISGMYLNLSPNGRYACMVALVKNAADKSVSVPVVYDIQEKKLIIYDEDQKINIMGAEDYPLFPTAIADNGTFIGTIGNPAANRLSSFIMRAGKTQAENFNDAFPSYAEKLGIAEGNGFNIPTGLSADASLILGYTFYSADYNTSFEEDPAYYLTYVIHDDYEYPDTAVEDIPAEAADATVEQIFTLDGRRTNTLTKGVNIVRMSDGTTRKVLLK